MHLYITNIIISSNVINNKKNEITYVEQVVIYVCSLYHMNT